jgi:hypothetical protein
VKDDVLPVAPSKPFAEQAENWLTPLNHNHLLIAPILKSLRLLGLEDEATTAFFRYLAGLYGTESA